MMNIKFSDFEKHINKIKKLHRFEYSISKAITEAYRDNLECEIILPSLEESVVDLLVIATGDRSELIPYWIYELNFGESYKDGMVTDDEGNNIKLATINDLWLSLKENNDK